MRIVLAGGVFGGEMATYASSAPEAVLARAFESAGHEVVPVSAGSEVRLTLGTDVYHANHFGVAAYQLALSGARPFVFTSHNPFLASGLDATSSRLEHALQRLVLRSADAIVALAQRDAERLAAISGVPSSRLVVIPNGLELDRYVAPARATGDGRIELLSVGQLVPYKGHGFLLEAVALLSRELPGLRLTIVSHQHDLGADYADRVAELGISERVSFEGPFETKELVRRYGACDIYVQPSLAECFPITVLEAMACGAPVIATDVGGVAEEVGDAGIVVPPADAAALATAIRELAGSAERRAELGRVARHRTERLYDARTVADRHLELYESLAGDRAVTPAYRRLAAAGFVRAYGNRGRMSRFVPAAVRNRGT